VVRRYDEPVEVRLADGPVDGSGPVGAPAAFRWRGRRYRVGAVQARWRERRAWWREVGEEGEEGDRTERVVWRVEATTGASAGVFELGADGGSRWLLLRALD
jgi:hypothetical protein